MKRLKCCECKEPKEIYLFAPAMQKKKSPVCSRCLQGQRKRRRSRPATPRGAAWKATHKLFFPNSRPPLGDTNADA